MPTKTGVIEDIRYEEDSKAGVVHVSASDGVHTATLPMEDIERYGLFKGLKVELQLDDQDNVIGLTELAE